jgi:hypothetical protein
LDYQEKYSVYRKALGRPNPSPKQSVHYGNREDGFLPAKISHIYVTEPEPPSLKPVPDALLAALANPEIDERAYAAAGCDGRQSAF